MYTDFYHILNVKYNSSLEDIKKSYKKLVLENHPDIYPNDKQKEDNFKKIVEAYETLSDPIKREKYNVEFILKKFKNLNSKKVSENLDIFISCNITLSEGYTGCTKTLSYYKKKLDINNNISLIKTNIDVSIKKGFFKNDIIIFKSLGNDSSNPNNLSGDLYVKVNIVDNKYNAIGLDIFATKHISCIDACIGTELLIKTLDNNIVNLTIPKGTQFGSTFKLVGKGLYDLNSYGDMYVNIIIDVPTKLDKEDIDFLKIIQQKQGNILS